MVDLLDIHVNPPQPNNDPAATKAQRLEILEAGTGHGSLTIHLSRAIAAANPPPPSSEAYTTSESLDEAWQKWRDSRGAVIHTVEFERSRSKDAANFIQSFRGGIYWPHIDFHSGDVGEWIKKEQRSRQQGSGDSEASKSDQFLDIVVLDLPGVHSHIKTAVQAMKDDAYLLVYVPQITQLAACQQEIERSKLPLLLDQVRELGEGISNGRVWDMRFIKTRAEQQLNQATSATENVEDRPSLEVHGTESQQTTASDDQISSHRTDVEFPTMVCRPMVGKLVMGGAFVGLWRKRTS